MSDLVYVNLYYNRHDSKNSKLFCKNFDSGEEAVQAGEETPGFIATLQLPKKDLEDYENMQDDKISR